MFRRETLIALRARHEAYRIATEIQHPPIEPPPLPTPVVPAPTEIDLAPYVRPRGFFGGREASPELTALAIFIWCLALVAFCIAIQPK
jgi:hypothetical protein